MTFASFHKEMKAHDIDHPYFGPAFLRATDLVIRLALTGQDALAKPLVAELVPVAKAVVDVLPGTNLDRLDRSNLAAVALLDLCKSMDWEAIFKGSDGRDLNLPLTRIAKMTRHGDGMVASVVLALLAHGRTRDAQTKADLEPLPPFVSGCLTGQALAGWPAWRDAFPVATAANAAFWHQLLFVAQMLAPKDKRPASWLRAEVA
jgi:hypothetical protein